MYAQCPECQTLFRITGEQLRAAGGRVRCSKCLAVFDAVATLRETLSDDELAAARAEQGAVRALAADNDFPVEDLFDVPEQAEPTDLLLEVPGYEIEEGADDEAALDAFLEPEMSAEFPVDDASLEAWATEHPDEAPDVPPINVPRDVADKLQELDANVKPEVALGLVRKRDWVAETVWSLLAVGLLLGLAVQWVHHYRHTLDANPDIGPLLRRAYALLNVDFSARVDLNAIRVRRTMVTAHETEEYALRFSTVMSNGASFPQAFPILLILVQDRWGETVAGRYFEPREYLPDNDPDGPMLPGKRYNVDVAILDPGREAVGFQIIPCTLRQDRHLCRENPANPAR